MSNFQKKYYYCFKSIDNRNHTVEIWQDSSTAIFSTEVIGASDSFTVTLNAINNKLQPVRGTGADLNLLATSSMQFIDLYTANIKEYQVRHYINSALNWCGYLDTEIFSSNISRAKNYPVSVSANDGFALLDRMFYLLGDGSKYMGISSQFDIISLILGKLSLPITNLYVAISTSVTGETLAAGETIFHKTFVQNSNFYNEDGEPFTLRSVLDAILTPYGAFIFQSGGNLYITDLNFIAGSDTSAKVYNGVTFLYSNSTTLNKFLGDLGTIGFAGTGEHINTVGAINKQIVKYSPYTEDVVIDYKPQEDVFSGTSSTNSYGTYPYRYSETTYTNSLKWMTYNNVIDTGSRFATLKGLVSNDGETDQYLYHPGDSYLIGQDLVRFQYVESLPSIVPTTKYFIKVEAKANCRTTYNMGEPSSVDVRRLELKTKLRLDNQYYSNSNGWVSDGYMTLYFMIATKDESGSTYTETNISDKYVDLIADRPFLSSKPTPMYVPLDASTGDTMIFQICGFKAYDENHTDISSSVLSVKLKDIKLTVVDENYNEITKGDIEYVGYVDPMYKNEGTTIETVFGTNTNDSPIQRGSLLKASGSSYAPILSWTRGGSTDIIENLLLRTCVGNYQNKSIEMTAITKLIPNGIGYLTYDIAFSGKKFVPVSLRNCYDSNKSEITMQEVFTDSLTINKSF